MNKSLKLTILLAAIIVAIGGVLLFIRTIVSPPQDLKFINQYQADLTLDINDFKNVSSDSLELSFTALYDKAYRYNTESAIDDKAYDKAKAEIIGIYAPKFSNNCFAMLNHSVWPDTELKGMESRIHELRNLTIDDGAKNIMNNYPEANEKFSTILRIIAKYREAKAFTGNSTFRDLSDAKSRISMATQYKKDNYLKNNIDLVNSLTSLPSRIEASHFALLHRMANETANFHHYSQNEYERYITKVVTAIKEYENNARNIYGTSHNTEGLKNIVRANDNNSSDYYYYR